MRYSSVLSTTTVPLRPRRRFGFLPCNRWRFPERERNTLPPAVILNRLATDFFVLMPFGRRIIIELLFEKSAKYRWMTYPVQAVFDLNSYLRPNPNPYLPHPKSLLPGLKPYPQPRCARGTLKQSHKHYENDIQN